MNKDNFDGICRQLAAQIQATVLDLERKLHIHQEPISVVESDAADPKMPNAPMAQRWTYGQPPSARTIRVIFDYALPDWTPNIIVASTGVEHPESFLIRMPDDSAALLSYICERVTVLNRET